MKYFSRLACFLLVLAAGTSLAETSPRDRFANGLEAYRLGEPDRALAHFQAARSGGLDTPALHYNLGVVLYKLNRLADARAAFLVLTRNRQWRALAHYNLGLVAERHSAAATAAHHFSLARDLAESDKIKSLASARLPVQAPPAPQRPWSGVASMGTGYDDNVTLGSELVETASDQEDAFAEAFLFAGRSLTGDADRGTVLDLGVYYQAHADLGGFDFGAISGTGSYHTPVGGSRLTTALKGEVLLAGGRGYAGVLTYRIQFDGGGPELRYRLRNDVSYVSGMSDFGHLSGWRNVSRMELTRQVGASRFRVGYEGEINDRRDLAAGDEFFSYSPGRHQLYALARFRVASRWTLELKGALQRSTHRDDDRFFDGDGELMVEARDETGHQASVRMSYDMGRWWSLWAELQHQDRDSAIRHFDYTSNRALLGMERFF